MKFLQTNAERDARKIQKHIDYRIIRAAWDHYVAIQRNHNQDYNDTYTIATPAWYALQAVRDHKGVFRSFEPEEIKFLIALPQSAKVYDNIITVLQEHGARKSGMELFIRNHPDFLKAVPPKYKNIDDAVNYMIQTVVEYQQLLQGFIDKYDTRIHRAIRYLQNASENNQH